MRNRLVSDWPSLCSLVGRGGCDHAAGALRWLCCCNRVAFAAFACSVRWLGASVNGALIVRNTGTRDRQLRGALALRDPHRSFFAGAPYDYGVLGCDLGACRPDSLHSADGLRGGAGPPRAPVLVSAHPAGRRSHTGG